MNERSNPFAELNTDELPQFNVKNTKKEIDKTVINKIAKEEGFPSRQARTKPSETATKIVPFQIRIPEADRLDIKINAAKLKFKTESEFVLACFREYIKNREQ